MKTERVNLLQTMPIFGGVSASGLELLSSLFLECSVAKGDYFFREGDQANSLFILEEGSAQVLKRNSAGTDIVLRVLKQGDCFGEMSLIDLNPRSASVIAQSTCRGIELSNHALSALYEQKIDQFALIQMNLLREVSRRLRDVDERMSAATEIV